MASVQKFRVLFVCLGNAIRSQMAEAFARAHAQDVVEPRSAGLSPAVNIPPLTRKVLADKGIELGDVFPKGLSDHAGAKFDFVVNLSGYPLPAEIRTPSREWKVKDPMGGREPQYREAADQIESLVEQLATELRTLRAQWAGDI